MNFESTNFLLKINMIFMYEIFNVVNVKSECANLLLKNL